MKTFKFSLVLRTRENIDVLFTLDENINGLHSNPAGILRKSTSGRHRPVSYPDGPMTARYRFM